MRPSKAKALEAAVYEAPGDDAPRAVFADWLLEQGDLRGEFIALQLRAASSALTRAESRRERQLLHAHRKEWTPEVLLPGLDVKKTRFSRGFVSGGALFFRSMSDRNRALNAPELSTWEHLCTADAALAGRPQLLSLRELEGLSFEDLLNFQPEGPLRGASLWVHRSLPEDPGELPSSLRSLELQIAEPYGALSERDFLLLSRLLPQKLEVLRVLGMPRAFKRLGSPSPPLPRFASLMQACPQLDQVHVDGHSFWYFTLRQRNPRVLAQTFLPMIDALVQRELLHLLEALLEQNDTVQIAHATDSEVDRNSFERLRAAVCKLGVTCELVAAPGRLSVAPFQEFARKESLRLKHLRWSHRPLR